MIQYVSMKRFIILFSLLVVLAPSFVWAQTTTTTTTTSSSTICSCYCKTSDGAMNIGVLDSVTSCQSACDSTDGYAVLGCYTDAQDITKPENNQLCWTEYECTTQASTDLGTSEMAFEWGGQRNSCVSGEGFCYKPMPPITLSVAIDDLTTANDLPEYLNAIYNWIIPAGALLAIVIVMIGGLQYALAHGESGKVTQAKDRIKNAVIGMVLLMFTFAIMNLIDPDLVTLHNLRVPQVRTVVFLDPNSTCEMMSAYGITIAPVTADTTCGNSGTVTSVEGYIGGGETTLAVGASCTYSTCSGAIETCMAVASAVNGFACVSCNQSYNDILSPTYAPNPDAPPPSASTCSQLLFSDPDPSDGEKYFCEYFDASAADITQADSCAEFVWPGGLSPGDNLDCDLLISDAKAEDSISCRMYDKVWAKIQGNNIALNNEVDDFQTNDTFPLLSAVCEADPCGLAPPGQSCEVFIMTPEVMADLALGLAGTGGLAFCATVAIGTLGIGAVPCVIEVAAFMTVAIVAAEVASDSVTIGNCAQTGSAGGIYYCLDKYGVQTDCNPSW